VIETPPVVVGYIAARSASVAQEKRPRLEKDSAARARRVPGSSRTPRLDGLFAGVAQG